MTRLSDSLSTVAFASPSPTTRRTRRHAASPARMAASPVPDDRRPHLTVAQLAERWQKHPDYLRRAILGRPAPDGIPEAFRVGRGSKAHWLIPMSAVEAYEVRHRAADWTCER